MRHYTSDIGTARDEVGRHDTAWHGVALNGITRDSTARDCTAFDTARHDTARCGVTRNDRQRITIAQWPITISQCSFLLLPVIWLL